MAKAQVRVLPSAKNTVMVVDDQSTGRAILEQVVRSLDERVLVEGFARPVDAVVWATRHVSDLVLVDYMMPDMDGIELVKRLRALPGYEHVPMVMVTVHDDRKVRYAALDAGITDFLTKPVDARECLARCRNLLTLRRQTLEVTLPENLPYIEGDLPRLTQVFVNLLANANKFAPEDSMVRIGAEAGDGHVLVWVEDEGPGPAAGESEAIFARFQRGSGEEPEPGGLGLGLWIVKSIIDRHAGTISMVRTEQGRTRFIITLPTEVTA